MMEVELARSVSGDGECVEECLRCRPGHEHAADKSNVLLEKIARCYADRLLSDITLQVGSRSFPSHRLILCASSDVFQVMLMNPNYSEFGETKIVLREDAACEGVFPDFLKYLYTVSHPVMPYAVGPRAADATANFSPTHLT